MNENEHPNDAEDLLDTDYRAPEATDVLQDATPIPPEVSPIEALAQVQRREALAAIEAASEQRRRDQEEDDRKRAEIIAVHETPRDVHTLAAGARDAALAYLNDHKDTTPAQKPYRDMVMSFAKVFDAIAQMR